MKSTLRYGYLAWIQVASTKLTRFKIEEALNITLASHFPSVAGRTTTARAEFYDKYKRKANRHDKDSIKKYNEDPNTTLIFMSERFVRHMERI